MKRILTLVKYDYLQRVRSYKFLIILCFSIAFAAILIPAPDSIYSTVSIGKYLGHLNSAWIAYVTAIMSSVFVSLIGYYIINNSIRIDQKNKMGQSVAASSITNFHYLISKFLGNFLILLTIIICVFIVGIILFFIYNTGYSFELRHFLIAYLLIPIPSIIFLSALAILLEVIFKEKTALHNVAFFVLFCAFIGQSNFGGRDGDLFGVSIPTQEMVRQVNEIDASSTEQRLNIGFVISHKKFDKRFNFTGININFQFLLFRLLWPLGGVFIVYFTSKFFHRFELNERSVPSKKAAAQDLLIEMSELQEIDFSVLPKLESSKSIWPVLKMEFLMMVRKGNKWLWFLNIIGMILLGTIPLEFAHKFVLPVLWFLQVHRWADLVTKEKRHQMHFFVYSSYSPVKRLLSAQFLAGIGLAVFLALPLVLRYLLLGDWLPATSILLGAIFIIGLSAFIGIATGGKRLFEILFFFIAYLNVNGLPYLDYFGGINNSLEYLVLLSIGTVALLVLSYFLRSFELRRM